MAEDAALAAVNNDKAAKTNIYFPRSPITPGGHARSAFRSGQFARNGNVVGATRLPEHEACGNDARREALLSTP